MVHGAHPNAVVQDREKMPNFDMLKNSIATQSSDVLGGFYREKRCDLTLSQFDLFVPFPTWILLRRSSSNDFWAFAVSFDKRLETMPYLLERVCCHVQAHRPRDCALLFEH